MNCQRGVRQRLLAFAERDSESREDRCQRILGAVPGVRRASESLTFTDAAYREASRIAAHAAQERQRHDAS